MAMNRHAVTVLILAFTLAGLAPLGAETTALSRILLPKDSEVIGTYDAQTQMLTCYTPHGRISGHMDPQAITGIKPMSSSETADSLAQMQSQVDSMVAEAAARAESTPPLVRTPRPTEAIPQAQNLQPAKPARPPRQRRTRTPGLAGGQPAFGQPNQQFQQPPTMQNLNQNPSGFTVVPAQSPPPQSP